MFYLVSDTYLNSEEAWRLLFRFRCITKAIMLLLVKCCDNKMVKLPRFPFYRSPPTQLTSKKSVQWNSRPFEYRT